MKGSINPNPTFSPGENGGDAAGLNSELGSAASLIGGSHDPHDNLFDVLTMPANAKLKQIWAVGGGKGGVGKSLVASSLAIALSQSGSKVIAVDLDLGGANLHTTLGVELPKQTLSDFLSHRAPQINQCIVPTGIPNLELISGSQDAVGVTQIDLTGKKYLLESLHAVDADYLVLDLGAGTNYTTIDFFLFGDIGTVVLLPEPTSIENAYRFIKSAYYRHLWHSRALREIRPLIEIAMDVKNSLDVKSPSDLFREVNRRSPEMAVLMKQEIEKFRPKLIVNQARTQADVDIGFSVKAVCKKYFGIEMDYVGYLDYDSSVWQAVRRKRPLFAEFPNSRLVSSLSRIVAYMVKRFATQKSAIRGTP